MAIRDEITRLQNAKSALKTSIEAKGVTVSDSTLISDYSAYVDQIPTGGGGGGGNKDLIDLIERDITTFNIPNGTTKIGDYAFNYCTALTSVIISNSVKSIGTSAFYGCISLTSIVIPNSVTSIDSSAFRNCSSLTSIVIPNSVTSIGSNVFNRCSGLTSIRINATTPPTLGSSSAFSNTNNCPIYVPAESVDAYKQASNWSSLADRIQAIPTV